MSYIPEYRSGYSPTYKKVNVAGVFGGITGGGLDAIVYSEERRADKALETPQISPSKMYIQRSVELGLFIDPLQMKAIHRWLGEKIAEYEQLFGNIPSPEEIEIRSKKRPEKQS